VKNTKKVQKYHLGNGQKNFVVIKWFCMMCYKEFLRL
jgi:hypothetical protein